MMGRNRAGVVPGKRNGTKTPPLSPSVHSHPPRHKEPQTSPSQSGGTKHSSCLCSDLQFGTCTGTLTSDLGVSRRADTISACFQPGGIAIKAGGL